MVPKFNFWPDGVLVTYLYYSEQYINKSFQYNADTKSYGKGLHPLGRFGKRKPLIVKPANTVVSQRTGDAAFAL